MIHPFNGIYPQIAQTAFVHEQATVIGDVHIGENSSIWPGVVLRGDLYFIRIGSHSNIQDNSTLHVVTGIYPVVVGDYVTVGHNVVLHGCTVKDRALIGMGAIVLDGAVVEEQAFVAAGALVAPGQVIPPRMLAVGSPAKAIRPLNDDDIMRMEMACQSYLYLKDAYLNESGQMSKNS
ncbi:MAG: gamma carbonic anhydrase family protein [Acidobacteriota bacterium]|nr:gamma carbonic anhydrase family protein [Blastocatellia bacterium]MDW8239654.1 gamma carbonic anhydrase family protein [Acidobacteriota bacterium]